VAAAPLATSTAWLGLRTAQADDAKKWSRRYRHLGHNPREAAMSTGEDRSSQSGRKPVQQAPGLWRTDLQ
jgi:hypothetical protein